MKNIILLFFFVSAIGFTQEINLTGAIRIDTKMSYIPDVIVKNLRTNETSVTNIFGRFKIKVQNGDILEFNGDNLHENSVKITEYSINRKNIIITMMPYVEELKEVVVYNYKLSGILKKDAFAVPFRNRTKEINEAMSLPKSYGDGKRVSYAVYKPTLAEFNKINVDAIFDIFSGNRKKRERLYAWEDRESEINYIKNYLGELFFTVELKIPSQFIREFLEFSYETTSIKYFLKSKDFSSINQSLYLQAAIFNSRLDKSNFK